MNLSHDHEDELQSIWRKDAADSRKEDYTMTLQLVREKGRTLHEFLRGGDTVSYMLLVFVPVLILNAWRWRMFRLGNLVLAITLAAMGVVTWINARRASAALENDWDLRAYQENLLHFIDERIRYLRNVKYWFGIPFLFGLSILAYSIAHHFTANAWSILAITSVWFPFGYCVLWYCIEKKGVVDLKRRRDDVESLLRNMDQTE